MSPEQHDRHLEVRMSTLGDKIAATELLIDRIKDDHNSHTVLIPFLEATRKDDRQLYSFLGAVRKDLKDKIGTTEKDTDH